MEKRSVEPTKTFLYLAMIDAFIYICPAVYATFLSAFYTQKGLTGTQTGILFGISPLMYILVQPHWDRIYGTATLAGALILWIILQFYQRRGKRRT